MGIVNYKKSENPRAKRFLYFEIISYKE